jgi:hypothetical protein
MNSAQMLPHAAQRESKNGTHATRETRLNRKFNNESNLRGCKRQKVLLTSALQRRCFNYTEPSHSFISAVAAPPPPSSDQLPEPIPESVFLCRRETRVCFANRKVMHRHTRRHRRLSASRLSNRSAASLHISFIAKQPRALQI